MHRYKIHIFRRLEIMFCILGFLLLASSSDILATFNKQIIMKSGDPAPGTNGAVYSLRTWDGPNVEGISDSGSVLFGAYLEVGVGDATADNNYGLWVKEDTIRLVMRKGGDVPGMPGYTFGGIRKVYYDLSGNIGLELSYSASGPTETAFFLEENGVLVRRIFVSMEVLPGVILNNFELVSFNAGRVIFTGEVAGGDICHLMYDQGVVRVLARLYEPMPVIGGDWLYRNVSAYTFKNPLDAFQRTIFQVQGRDFNTGDLNGVVYTWSPAGGHDILRQSGIDSTSIVMGEWRMNSFAWAAQLRWETFGLTKKIVGVGGNLFVTEGDVADGAGAATFNKINEFVLFDNSTDVGIVAKLSDNRNGIWIGDVTGLKKVALSGDQVPGMPAGTNFSFISSVSANKTGKVAFMDMFSNGVDWVTSLWEGDAASLDMVSISGEQIEIAPDTFKTIQDIFTSSVMGTRTGADGQPTVLNDSEKIPFRAVFIEGGYALLLASPGGLVVNSAGDAPDADTTDERCDTGNLLPDGRPECTLRAAIMQANALSGRNTITFDITEDPRIVPLAVLPDIRDSVVIDAFSQPGNDRVIIDGNLTPGGIHGLIFDGEDITVQGLAIGRFDGNGIYIRGSDQHNVGRNKVFGCYIGYISTAGLDFGNGGHGIYIKSSSDNIIGGAERWQRNYITSNLQDGIKIDFYSFQNHIYNNYIGFTPSGNNLGNAGAGVMIDWSDSNFVGGRLDSGNVISGNALSGIEIKTSNFSVIRGNSIGKNANGIMLHTSSLHNRLTDNYIGVKENGQADGNLGYGVLISNKSDSNFVGNELNDGNVISGNVYSGVEVKNSDYNIIKGNFIGNNADGVILHSGSLHNRIIRNNIGVQEDGQAAGNLGYGVLISTLSDSNFVGDSGDSRNIISGNKDGGIAVVNSNYNIIGGNYIGTDPTGILTVANHGEGIIVKGSKGTFIGVKHKDNQSIEKIPNVISGNDSAGVAISTGCRNTIITSNLIGVGSDGSTPVPNYWGITVFEAPHTYIGLAGQQFTTFGNIISENKFAGISLLTDSSTIICNKILHNGYLGNDTTGSTGGHGIYIDGSDNLIGSYESDFLSNVISNNSGTGIAVDRSNNRPNNHNTIYSNMIFENLGGGIDLWPTGSNPIDNVNPGNGPNDGQNAALLESVTFTFESMIILRGELISRPNQQYLVHAYHNDICDPDGLGQGQRWGFVDSITTDNSGLSEFNITFGPFGFVPSPHWTVTVTDMLGNSSEYSNCLPMITSGVDLRITKSDLEDSVSLQDTIHYRINITNFGPDTAKSVMVIDSIPILVSFISDSVSQGLSSITGNIFTCQMGDLAPGTDASVDIFVRATQIGNIVNKVYVSSTSPESYLSNNIDTDTTISRDHPTDVEDNGINTLPTNYELSQNYPNPFNPSTSIEFDLPRRSHVSLSIFNTLGQKVAELIDEEYSAGRHQITWDGNSSNGKQVSTGIYFYRLVAGDFINTKKMILLK